MTDLQKNQLVSKAVIASNNAYSPYSGFKVGAALLCKDGSVYTGCNIENSSYSATNCAERTAFQTAVADGKRDFIAIAIVGGKDVVGKNTVSPCGICRQVMAEFCSGDFVILLGNENGFEECTLSQLLPLSFSKKDLK